MTTDGWDRDPPWIGPHQFIRSKVREWWYCAFCGGHERGHDEERPPELTDHEALHPWVIQTRPAGSGRPRGYRYRCLCGSVGNWRDRLDDAVDGHAGHVKRAAR